MTIVETDKQQVEKIVRAFANEISLEHNVLIDARVISQERFYGEWGRLSYLAEDIQNEGIVIWKRSGIH